MIDDMMVVAKKVIVVYDGSVVAHSTRRARRGAVRSLYGKRSAIRTIPAGSQLAIWSTTYTNPRRKCYFWVVLRAWKN